MAKDEAAALAAGQDDMGIAALCSKYGPAVLACGWEGLELSHDRKTTDFSRQNPFVPFAVRAGVIEAVCREMPFPDGQNAPVVQTLFKGE